VSLSFARWPAVAHTGPAVCLVGDVVLEVAVAGWSPAGRGDTDGVPDLGQVPQLDPRVMTAGLEPVVARVQGDRVQGDQQVPLAGQAGGQPPGPVPAGRPVLAGAGEGEPWRVAVAGPAGRIVVTGRGGSAGRGGFVPPGGVQAVAGFGSGAAVADGVAVLVGDGEAVRSGGVGGGGAGQVPGQGGVARGGTRDEIRSFRERPGPRTTTAPISLTRCNAAESGGRASRTGAGDVPTTNDRPVRAYARRAAADRARGSQGAPRRGD